MNLCSVGIHLFLVTCMYWSHAIMLALIIKYWK